MLEESGWNTHPNKLRILGREIIINRIVKDLIEFYGTEDVMALIVEDKDNSKLKKLMEVVDWTDLHESFYEEVNLRIQAEQMQEDLLYHFSIDDLKEAISLDEKKIE